MKNSKLVIFSAPSGAGKTTLVRHLLDSGLGLEFSVSATSREKRPGEKDGSDYYFLSAAAFRERIDRGEFLEWEEVYEGHYYGTLRSEIARIWARGKHVIFDVDVVGGLNIKAEYGDAALSVFVMPPDPSVLEQRLRKRSTESEESLRKRLGKARHELSFADRFDRVLVNDDLEAAKEEAVAMVREFLEA